jgi:hypothetical protein
MGVQHKEKSGYLWNETMTTEQPQNGYRITEEEWLRIFYMSPDMAKTIHSRPVCQQNMFGITPDEWEDVMYSVVGISPFESQDPDDMRDYPIPDGVEILKNVRRRGFVCSPARSDRERVLDNFAQWVKTEWVQEAIKDYKEELRQSGKQGGEWE